MTRREFARAATGLCAIPAISLTTVPATAAAPNLFVRKSVKDLKPADWKVFDEVVQTMKDKGTWNKIADLHATSCPHKNWFFLPWHRAYLYFFEMHARAITKHKSFTLPYWDWSDPKQRKIPTEFTKGALKHEKRVAANLAKEINNNKVGTNAMQHIFVSALFTSFGGKADKDEQNLMVAGIRGTLESGPHTAIHDYVGLGRGNTPDGDMRDKNAAYDPIFWVHHANVDRIWAKWCNEKPSSGTSREWPADEESKWFTTPLKFKFGDGDGEKVVKDTLSTVDLDYTYDEFGENPVKSVVVFPKVKSASTIQSEEKLLASFTDQKPEWSTKILLNKDLIDGLKKYRERGADAQIPGEVRLRLEFASTPARGGDLRVFVNNPKANRKTQPDDPSSVGYISFFPDWHGKHDHRKNESAYLVISEALLRTEFTPNSDRPLLLTCIADDLVEKGGELQISRIDLEVIQPK